MKTKLIKVVSEVFGTTPKDIKGKGRTKPEADARAVCFYFLRKKGMTVETVGEFLNRHHTTVVLGTQKVDSLLSFDKSFIKQVEEVIEMMPELREVAQ
jgi:chromosomal replication initiation ATPase DnaA